MSEKNRKKKKKSGLFSTVLFFVLLIAGLGVMLYPTISDYIIRRQLSEQTAMYNRILAQRESSYSSYDEMIDEAKKYNEYLLSKDVQLAALSEEREWAATLLNPLGNGMMGTLSIPAIDVDLPIYQGTEEEELQSGAGWWIGTSMPIGGESTHSVITAHTGLVKAKLFTDLDKLEEGDIFKIQILDRELYYEVDQILVTLPEETDPLKIVEGEDYVTLYTCTPYGVNTHRLLVRGRRILDPSERVVEEFETQNNDWLWIILACASLIPLLWWLMPKHKAPAPLPTKEKPVMQPGFTRSMPKKRCVKHHRKKTTKKSDAAGSIQTKASRKQHHMRRANGRAVPLSRKKKTS